MKCDRNHGVSPECTIFITSEDHIGKTPIVKGKRMVPHCLPHEANRLRPPFFAPRFAHKIQYRFETSKVQAHSSQRESKATQCHWFLQMLPQNIDSCSRCEPTSITCNLGPEINASRVYHARNDHKSTNTLSNILEHVFNQHPLRLQEPKKP